MAHELWHEVYDFLTHEARLLDERRLEEWLDLLTDDILYWMPMRSKVSRADSDHEVSTLGELPYIEDDKDTLRMRVARLATGMAWGEDPPARTRHIITNVEVDSGPGDQEATARCALFVYRTTQERDVELFVGSREDLLRREDGGWKIARRTIVLDQTVLDSKSLSTFF